MLKNELKHFNNLSFDARKLFFSNVLVSAGSIISGLFTSAYIWGKTNDINLITAKYFTTFIVIYLTFLVNGFLLKKIKIGYTFALGLVLVGLMPVVLVSLDSLNLFICVLLGILDGIGTGFYWSNRNYMEQDSTNDANRNYFASIGDASSSILTVLIPVLVGWFLSGASGLVTFSKDIAYLIIMLVSFSFFLFAALMMLNNKFHNPLIKEMFLSKPDNHWNRIRLQVTLHSIPQGINFFLPVLLILSLIGTEKELGIVQSFAALFSALVIYLLGRKLSVNKRFSLMIIASLLMIFGASSIVIYFSAIGVLIYEFIRRIAGSMQYVLTTSAWYKSIEINKNNEGENYKYFCDMELFINIGRLIGISFLILLVRYFGTESAIRFSPLIIIVSEIIFTVVVRKISRIEDNLTNNSEL